MLIHVYATEAEAERAIDAITAAQGATEDVRLPDGTIETRPRKRWMAAPVALQDGTWGVAWKSRLAPVEGRSVAVRGEAVAVPLARDAVEVAKADVRPPEVDDVKAVR